MESKSVATSQPLSFSARRAQARFEELVRPHLDHLYRVAFRFAGDADRAEDLIQELLIRVYPRCEELAQIEKPRPWLARVLYRLFVDQVRKDAREPQPLRTPDAGGGGEDEDAADPVADLADFAPGPEQELELKFDRERIVTAWEQLNPDHRALITLFEIEGYTLEELEAMLDVTRGTLKSRLHRARTHLAALLMGKEPF